MDYLEAHPGYELATEEQARNWIQEQLDVLPAVARGVNAIVPDNLPATGEFRQKAYRVFLTKHGGVLGQLLALYRARKLSKGAFVALRQATMALLGPSLIIGRYDWITYAGEVGLTATQAHAWVLEQIDRLQVARVICNVVFPKDHDKTVQYQKDAERLLLVRHGGVLGVLVALHRCRLLSDVGYNELREQAMAVLVPTLVGDS